MYGWQWLPITTAVGPSEVVRAVRWLGIADTWPGAVLIVTGGIVVIGGSAKQLLDTYGLQFRLFDDMTRLEFTGTVPESVPAPSTDWLTIGYDNMKVLACNVWLANGGIQ